MAPEVLAPWAEPVPGPVTVMTAAELAHQPDDGWIYELVEGRLVRMPPAGTNHGGYGADLLLSLGLYVRSHRLGRVFTTETGFLLSGINEPDTVLGADVAFVRTERLPARGTEQTFWRLAPDLIAEIASPNQYRPEMAAKVQIWLGAGVRLAWVVWPARRQVDIWRPGRTTPVATLKADEMLDGLDVVPGFTVPVAELFQ